MKAATYCRVSTDEQVENGTSLETQQFPRDRLQRIIGDLAGVGEDRELIPC